MQQQQRGYWATHEYERRAVIDLDGKSFCGWNQLLRLIEAANDKDRYSVLEYPYLSSRDKSLVATTFLTGSRIGEVVMMRKSMFRSDDRWIYCEKVPLLKRWRYVGGNVKKRKAAGEEIKTKSIPATRDFCFPRTEPLSDYLTYWLSEAEDYLFPSRFHNHKNHIGGVRAWQIINDLAKRIGFDCWPHRLRSERASQLATEYGWRVEDLMRFFGWKTTGMAIRYAHTSIEDMKNLFPKPSIEHKDSSSQKPLYH